MHCFHARVPICQFFTENVVPLLVEKKKLRSASGTPICQIVPVLRAYLCESGRLVQNGKRAEIQKWEKNWPKNRKWPSARNGEKMAQKWRKNGKMTPNPIFSPFLGHFFPISGRGPFSIFGQFFPIFGFRPVFRSIPGGLTRKPTCICWGVSKPKFCGQKILWTSQFRPIYCRDQNCSGSGKMLPGINFLKFTDFIAG